MMEDPAVCGCDPGESCILCERELPNEPRRRLNESLAEYEVRLIQSRAHPSAPRVTEALAEIAAGAWTESGDILGAAFSELRAIHIASRALNALSAQPEVRNMSQTNDTPMDRAPEGVTAPDRPTVRSYWTPPRLVPDVLPDTPERAALVAAVERTNAADRSALQVRARTEAAWDRAYEALAAFDRRRSEAPDA